MGGSSVGNMIEDLNSAHTIRKLDLAAHIYNPSAGGGEQRKRAESGESLEPNGQPAYKVSSTFRERPYVHP